MRFIDNDQSPSSPLEDQGSKSPRTFDCNVDVRPDGVSKSCLSTSRWCYWTLTYICCIFSICQVIEIVIFKNKLKERHFA